jgi:hypothetical protein
MATREERTTLAMIPRQAVVFIHPPVQRLLRLGTSSYLRLSFQRSCGKLFEIDSGRVVNIQSIDRVDVVVVTLTVIWPFEDSAMKRTVVKLTDTAGHTSVLSNLVEGNKTFNLVVVRKLGVFSGKLPWAEVCPDPECVADDSCFP